MESTTPIDIHISGSKGPAANARILTAAYPTEHSSRMFSRACRVSNETFSLVPGIRTWKQTVLGKRERIATGGLRPVREKRDGEPGRCAPLGAPSEGGLTAGERERVNVLRSNSLEGLLRLELLERDWPLP